jgi:hypothetical protein
MSLQEKIRKLVEAAENEVDVTSTVNEADDEIEFDISSMSDSELAAEAEKAGLEELIILDGEGGLVNREEIEHALKTIELNSEEVVVEADVEAEEAELELPPDEETSEEETPEEAEETPEEDEEAEGEVTVVVVSPELKAEDEDDLEADLPEEVKSKYKAAFESAVSKQVLAVESKLKQQYEVKASKLEEKFAKKLEDAKQEIVTENAKLVDGYLSEAVDTWVSENSVVLEQNVRAELAEEFIDGLKTLFVEHYIEVPQEKFDLVKAQEDKIAQLEESVSKLKASRMTALKEATQLKCENIVANVSKEMTLVDKTKFKSLVEDVEFADLVQFESKVKTLAESFVKQDVNKPTVRKTKQVMTEAATLKPETTAMDHYVQTLSTLL